MNESNGTCYEPNTTKNSHQVEFLFLVINTLLCVIGLGTNLFIGIAFYKNRAALKTPSNRLVFSLLISDTLSGINVMAQITISLKFKHIIVVRIFDDIITAFLAYNVVLHLCGITLDRFIAVYFALKYKKIVTLTFITRYIKVAWLLSIFASGIQLVWVYADLKNEKGFYGRSDEERIKITNIEKWYSFAILLIFLLFPMMFLGLALSAMFYEIRKILLKTKLLIIEKPCCVKTKQLRVIYMFTCMYVCFFIFAMPYFTIRMVEDFQIWCASQVILQIVYTLKSTPHFVNSILYSFFNKKMKNNLKYLIKACLKKAICSKEDLQKTNSLIY
ncbi:C-C chemokine receptor type 5-like [Hydra vulgaris]|uniref:C-C chemokine receptor type 5-like n=1 Tax=Hydra vulgaris TaxID=6087 RepID=UPI001F5E817C|nr:C-C chemokine receptor type 5-like [Hydra vulgaris]